MQCVNERGRVGAWRLLCGASAVCGKSSCRFVCCFCSEDRAQCRARVPGSVLVHGLVEAYCELDEGFLRVLRRLYGICITFS